MKTRRARFNRREGTAALSALAAACALVLPGLQPAADAITRRDDVLDQTYIDYGNQFQLAPVGALLFGGGGASATLITPKFILTAGHTTATTTDHTFILGPTFASQDQYHSLQTGTNTFLVFNNGYNINDPNALQAGNDIGLIGLGSVVTTAAPASRYFGVPELSLTATAVGYGYRGPGSTGFIAGTYGTKRAADNVIDTFGGTGDTSTYSQNIMLADFDDPGNADGLEGIPGHDTNPLPMEGLVTSGDSGGGTFFTIDGRTYVSGVNSFFLAFQPPNGDYNNSSVSINSSYSDGYGATRVTIYNKWIDDNIANYWAVAPSGGSFSNSSNWTLAAGGFNSHASPTTGDIAGFKSSGVFTVNFDAGATVNNYQLLARTGTITLNLNGGTYNLTSSAYEGGIVIGRYNAESTGMTFINGTVNSHDVILGQTAIQGVQQPAIGQLVLGTGAKLNVTADPTTGVTGDVYVGGTFSGSGGIATLTIQSSTSALNASGRLRVYLGSRVNYNAGSLSVGTLEMGFSTFDGGQIVLQSGGGKALRAKSVTFASGATANIDLTDNDMIVDYDGSSPLNQLRGYIQSGYAANQWNGAGINSSFARLFNTSPTRTALGYGEAGSLGITNFDGFGVDSTTVLVKYTWTGDANLDGIVDINDLRLFALNWGLTGKIWTTGDFNYDGTVNSIDLGLMALNWHSPFGAQALPALVADLGLPPVAVPEPASLGLGMIGLIPLLKRRRRRL